MNQNSEIRAFIAISIPKIMKSEIGKSIDEMRSKITGSQVKWVKVDNIHLTLKFLGNTPKADVQEIADELEIRTKNIEGFTLELSQIGVFPNLRKPKVIWVGCTNPPPLILLAKIIDQVSFEHGFEKENRSFSPHLTIGRIKTFNQKDHTMIKDEIIKNRTVYFGSFDVLDFTLFKSDLTPKGPHYTAIRTIRL